MPLLGEVIGGIVIIIATIYIIAYYIYPASNADILTTMLPLNKKKDILVSDTTQTVILGSSGSTVMGFFKLNDGDRTQKFSNQYTPLIQVEHNWALELIPSSKGKDNPSARLRVITNHGGKPVPEIIELPSIPKQKWMFIAILREGRRFDVIYDNRIVASHRLENYPVIYTSPLSVGNEGLDGSVIHVIVRASRLTPTEVERERVTHVNTNNMILEANITNFNILPNINLSAQCPSGLPCSPVTQPPPNNLVKWSTPYA